MYADNDASEDPEDILSSSLATLYEYQPITLTSAGSHFTYTYPHTRPLIDFGNDGSNSTTATTTTTFEEVTSSEEGQDHAARRRSAKALRGMPGEPPSIRSVTVSLRTPDTQSANWALHASSVWMSSVFLANHIGRLDLRRYLGDVDEAQSSSSSPPPAAFASLLSSAKDTATNGELQETTRTRRDNNIVHPNTISLLNKASDPENGTSSSLLPTSQVPPPSAEESDISSYDCDDDDDDDALKSDFPPVHIHAHARVRILELGAGAGLPSILLAKLLRRSNISKRDAEVVVSDYPDAELIKTLSDNVDRNRGSPIQSASQWEAAVHFQPRPDEDAASGRRSGAVTPDHPDVRRAGVVAPVDEMGEGGGGHDDDAVGDVKRAQGNPRERRGQYVDLCREVDAHNDNREYKGGGLLDGHDNDSGGDDDGLLFKRSGDHDNDNKKAEKKKKAKEITGTDDEKGTGRKNKGRRDAHGRVDVKNLLSPEKQQALCGGRDLERQDNNCIPVAYAWASDPGVLFSATHSVTTANAMRNTNQQVHTKANSAATTRGDANLGSNLIAGGQRGPNRAERGAEATKFDIVMAADTLWNSTLHDMFLDTLTWVLKRSTKARIHLVAGLHTGRYTLQSFMDRVGATGLVFESLTEYEVTEEGEAGLVHKRDWDLERETDEQEKRRWVVWMVLKWDDNSLEGENIAKNDVR